MRCKLLTPGRFFRALCLLSAVLSTHLHAQSAYKDVAPIFIQHCMDCHHPGKVFPYLNHYSAIVNYRSLIASNLQSGNMPPWPADTSYRRYAHERVITQPEKSKILNWIANGAPAGDTTAAAQPPAYSNTRLYGTPDLILSTPAYTSTASYNDKNICFAIPTNLTSDRVLRAYEVVQGNNNLAHHVILVLDTLGTSISDFSGACDIKSYGVMIGGWAPGSQPVVFPSKAPVKLGIPIKHGSKLVLQVHYPAGTASLSDSIQVRLFFYPPQTSGVRTVSALPVKNNSFTIPANGTATISAVYPRLGNTPSDLSVFSIFPHSHKICTNLKNYASDGNVTIPLCRINQWDFNWQGFYTFRKLTKIPAGYKIYGIHGYDNTSANPYHSPMPVSAGPGTDDEMLIDVLLATTFQAGDDTVDIASIIEADTLLKPRRPASHMAAIIDANNFAYPNPSEGEVTISCHLTEDTYVNLTIYNVLGEKVRDLCSRVEPAGFRAYVWDGMTEAGSRVTTGMYVYHLEINGSGHYGKILMISRRP